MQPFNENKLAGLSSQIMRVLAKVSPGGDLPCEVLAQAVVNLSRLFTTARTTLPLRYLDDPAHASAYLSYFLPVNLSKVQVLLDELPEDSGMEASNHSMAVLDLGCGPGTGALALLDWLWHRSPELAKSLSVLATDASHAPLRDIAGRLEYQHQDFGVSRAIWNIRSKAISANRLCGVGRMTSLSWRIVSMNCFLHRPTLLKRVLRLSPSSCRFLHRTEPS